MRDQNRGVSRISQAEYISKFTKGRVYVCLWLKWGIMWSVELAGLLVVKGKVDEGEKHNHKTQIQAGHIAGLLAVRWK